MVVLGNGKRSGGTSQGRLNGVSPKDLIWETEWIHDYAPYRRPSLACLIIESVGKDPRQLLDEFEEACTALDRQAQGH